MTQRLLLLHDGTAVGSFIRRDHGTHVIVLEPNGHSYTYVSPAGKSTRHLTLTALSAHREMVVAVLEFRNTYSVCASRSGHKLPYVCALNRLYPRCTVRRSMSRQVNAVSWPVSSSYSRQALWNRAQGTFDLRSIDSSAQVSLHASGKIVLVSYPVDATDRQEQCVIQQIFPVPRTPACFAHPVNVLLAAVETRGSHDDSFIVAQDARSATRSTVQLPENGAVDAQLTFRPLHDEVSTHSSVISPQLDSISIENIARWIKTYSTTMDQHVAVEETGGMMYIVEDEPRPGVLMFGLCGKSSIDNEWLSTVFVHCEYGGYFVAHGKDGYVTQQFTAETLPLELDGLDCERTLALLTRQYTLSCAIQTTASENFSSRVDHDPTRVNDGHGSTALLEEAVTSDGRFRAYADNRVRAMFNDRTILQLGGEGLSECSFTYRDGSTGVCTIASASPEQADYISVALDFAQWAFASPAERFQMHLRKLEQQQMIARELHKISVRRTMNSNEVSATEDEQPVNQPQVATALSPDQLRRLCHDTEQHMNHVEKLLTNKSP